MISRPLFFCGMALLIVGFGFKIAAVPFHMWTPDVYEGAPTSITAYMATGVKAAAFGAFLRVFYTGFFLFIEDWSAILWFIAVLTMIVGNIIALVQNNIKRLLAYSSIAHAGYILVAFVTGDKVLSSSILFYLMVYAFMNIGAFTIVILLGRKGEPNEEIESYAGLAARHPFIALSMSYIPALAGRHSAACRVHGQVLYFQRGDQDPLLLARRDRRSQQRGGSLLLLEGLDVHVFQGAGTGARRHRPFARLRDCYTRQYSSFVIYGDIAAQRYYCSPSNPSRIF